MDMTERPPEKISLPGNDWEFIYNLCEFTLEMTIRKAFSPSQPLYSWYYTYEEDDWKKDAYNLFLLVPLLEEKDSYSYIHSSYTGSLCSKLAEEYKAALTKCLLNNKVEASSLCI